MLSHFEGEMVYSDIQVYKFISLFMSCYEVEQEIVVAALIYTDRLLTLNSHIQMTPTTAKSFLHTALVLASKFFLDRFEKNTIFYAVGGISKSLMRNMTDSYLTLLDFNLNIDEAEFYQYMSKLKTMIAYKFAQTGQIVVLEKNLRKKSGVKTFDEKTQKISVIKEDKYS